MKTRDSSRPLEGYRVVDFTSMVSGPYCTRLLADMGEVLELKKATVTSVGESSVSALKTRPDYAITVQQALVGFIELKAPGKGAGS